MVVHAVLRLFLMRGFEVSIAGGPPIAVAVEDDRGTEEQKVWREKIAAYSVWVNGPYQKAFTSDNLTIAIALS